MESAKVDTSAVRGAISMDLIKEVTRLLAMEEEARKSKHEDGAEICN